MVEQRLSQIGAACNSTVPITVAIVEDEPNVRTRFEAAVRSHPRLSLLFAASTAAQALELTQQRPANVVLIDLGLPDKDGREVIKWLMVHYPATLAMVVTVFADEEHVLTSLEAGAVGYLLKDTPGDEIARYIVELFEGGSPISPSVARSVIKRFTGKKQDVVVKVDNPLSERELEVLRLIEKGMSYEEVSEILGITWHTVTAHLRNVYRKLQVNSKGQAVFEAKQRGFL
jgi:DNA-binding NarL/FixJ family response regulator